MWWVHRPNRETELWESLSHQWKILCLNNGWSCTGTSSFSNSSHYESIYVMWEWDGGRKTKHLVVLQTRKMRKGALHRHIRLTRQHLIAYFPPVNDYSYKWLHCVVYLVDAWTDRREPYWLCTKTWWGALLLLPIRAAGCSRQQRDQKSFVSMTFSVFCKPQQQRLLE